MGLDERLDSQPPSVTGNSGYRAPTTCLGTALASRPGPILQAISGCSEVTVGTPPEMPVISMMFGEYRLEP